MIPRNCEKIVKKKKKRGREREKLLQEVTLILFIIFLPHL